MQRSCRCAGLSRAAYYRIQVAASERDADVVTALNALIERHPRWGFWKCRKALRRKGHPWNHKRVYRVYCALRLNLKRRVKRKLPLRIKQPLFTPGRPNEVWSADFMCDTLYSGNRFRTFNVIDDFNRKCLAVEIDSSITGKRLIRVFERLKSERGLSETLRVDNGPEFLSGDFVAWAEQAGMTIRYIEPGQPNQNAYVERFNRTYREEFLSLYLFRNLNEVREGTHRWRTDYNESRPHDSLGDLTPDEYRQHNAGNSTYYMST